jgi:hypothetical protein
MKVSRLFLLLLLLAFNNYATAYPLRKYENVSNFYKDLIKPSIELGIKYKVPPAAVLAIAGHESGYGSGYISEVSGNILSLNAKGDSKELPALRLARDLKTRKLLFDPIEINKLPPSQIKYEKRPPSYKKDYRPSSIAASSKNLVYFRRNPKEKLKANLKCIEEFMKNWIKKDSYSSAYKNARAYLNKVIAKRGIKALFDKDVNETFIYTIGGKKGSFNHRSSWAPSVVKIMNRVGIVELTRDIWKNNKSFYAAWGEKPTKNVTYTKSYRKNYTKNTTTNQTYYLEYKTPSKYYVDLATKHKKTIDRVSKKYAFPAQIINKIVSLPNNYTEKILTEKRYGITLLSLKTVEVWNSSAPENLKIKTIQEIAKPEVCIELTTWYLANLTQKWRKQFGNSAYTLALLEYFYAKDKLTKICIYDKSKNNIVIKDQEAFYFIKRLLSK